MIKENVQLYQTKSSAPKKKKINENVTYGIGNNIYKLSIW